MSGKIDLKIATVILLLCASPTSLYGQNNVLNLSNLTGDQHGFNIIGVGDNDEIGDATASGDFNGDGVKDIIIGGPNGNAGGSIHIFFGRRGDLSKDFFAYKPEFTNGITITAANTGDKAGTAVTFGDINNDGLDDAIFSIPRAANGGTERGGVGVLYGRKTEDIVNNFFAYDDALIDLRLSIPFDNSRLGTSLATGDINGDGIADIVVGAESAPGGGIARGQVFVVFGKDGPLPPAIDVSGLDGTDGFTINGAADADFFGSKVVTGDFNGDGIADIGASAPTANVTNDGILRGRVFVFLGKNSAFPAVIEVSDLGGTDGLSINGTEDFGQTGSSLALGDLNGDGKDDLAIGTTKAALGGTNRGRVDVFFGSIEAFPPLTTGSVNGINGFSVNGQNDFDETGAGIAIGDFNNDGSDELVIGVPGSDRDGEDSGRLVIVFRPDNDAPIVQLNDNSPDFPEFTVGISGRRLGIGGLVTDDIDGDGDDDILIGDPLANAGGIQRGRVNIFTNTNRALIDGPEGFMLLGSPTFGNILEPLVSPLFTSGAIGADDPLGDPSLFKWNRVAQRWDPIIDIPGEVVSPGQGVGAFVFEDDNGPIAPGANTGFPKEIHSVDSFFDVYTNVDPAGGTVSPVENGNQEQFFSLGNTLIEPLNWDATEGWTRTNVSNTFYIFKSESKSFVSWNGSVGSKGDGLIAPFQGFFADGFADGSLVSWSTAATKISRANTSIDQNDIAFKITATSGNMANSTWVSFQLGGEAVRDIFDGYQLSSFADNFIELATVSDSRVFEINALPQTLDQAIALPLHIFSTEAAAQATLTFTGLESFDGWQLSIFDAQTDQETPIQNDSQIIVEVPQVDLLGRSLPAVPTPLRVSPNANGYRYELRAVPPVAVSIEDGYEVPTKVELAQNYPNPFNPTTNINFSLPQAAYVRLEVFDLLGRKVSSLINSQQAAGRHSISFDASALSSGIYIYRLRAGNSVLTRKLTLIK